MKDKTMRELKALQKEKDWILQKGCNRNNKLHDFDILVNTISSNSNDLSRWSFTGREWIKVDPTPKNLINFHVQSFQTIAF